MTATARIRARLTGLAAILALLAALVGIPAGLHAVAGSPIPTSLPSWQHIRDVLTSPDDGTLFLAALLLAGWLAWAVFALSVLLEAAARLRHRPAPQLPAIGLPQRAAYHLVGAAVLLFTATPAAYATTQAPPAPAAAAPATPQPAAAPVHPTETHVVRRGETLWGIAEHDLGAGDRYPQIVAASRGITQPGGRHLTDPDVIDIGWKLQVPTGPTNTANHPQPLPKRSAPPGHQHPRQPPPGAPASSSAPELTPARTPAASASDTPSTSASAEAAPAPPNAAEHHADDEPFPVRTAAGVGSLLAAGVLTLIATRRRTQQAHRPPGCRIPMPTGPAAAAERDLRAAADPLSLATVDLALRTLAAGCGRTGQPLPVVRAARLTATQFDLYLDEPAHLPTPWVGTADAAVWTLPADADDLLDPDTAGDISAPYPSLVTVGHDSDDGHVLLDLEYLGAFGISGPPDATREVLAAIAVELATSCWADDLQLTVVGAYPELDDALQTGRVRYLPAAGHLLQELTTRAARDRDALTAAAAADLNQARAAGTATGIWTPEIVLLTTPLTPTQRTQLAALVEQLPRVAIAAVTAGDPVGEWRLRLDDDSDTAVLEPIGLRIRPQRIPDDTYAQLLHVAATAAVSSEPATPEEADYSPEPTLTDGPATAARDADDLNIHDRDADALDADARDAAHPPSATPQPPPTTKPAEATPHAAPPRTGIATLSDDPVPPPAADRGEPASIDRPAPTDEAPPIPSIPVQPAGDTDGDTDLPADEANLTATDDLEPPPAEVRQLPNRLPRILLLGTVEIVNADGPVEPSKRHRLKELAAFIALHPGADHLAIDAAYSPGRPVRAAARNTAMSKLRRWLGENEAGEAYLPPHQGDTGYRLRPEVRTDWHDWCALLPDGPPRASTDALEQALTLVRGTPFDAVGSRYYAWAELLRQEMISAIADASYELARRRYLEGRWRAAQAAAVVGLTVEPALERLHRMRIIAAHASGNAAGQREAIARLMTAAEDLGGDLEPETEELLRQLRDTRTPPDRDQLAGFAR